MSKELVIGSNRHETKVAILEEDQLVEIYFQRANEYSLAGSIHKGRVTRVLPGMQSAFVDLGLERDTFLYVSDFFEEHEDIDTVSEDPKPARSAQRDRDDRRSGRHDRGGPREQLPTVAAPVEDIEDTDTAVEDEVKASQRQPDADNITGADVAAGQGNGVEDDAVAEEQVSVSPLTGMETGPADTSDNRNRRRRRSRRRRNRGQGFPEHKYAQPSERAAAGAPPVNRTAEESAEEADDDIDDEGAADVLLLPGESIAKYKRNADAPASPEPAFVPAPDEPRQESDVSGEPAPAATPEVAEAEPPKPADQPEDIAEEARELALADRVFSHADVPEEQLAPVDSGEPMPEPPAREPDRSDPVAEEAHHDASNFSAPFEPAASVQSAALLDDAKPLTTYEANAPFIGRSEEFPTEDSAEAEVLSERAEIAEYSEEIEAKLDEPAEAEVDAPQTAVLRQAPENRRLQRSSRRMRRRRGGNRFGQQAEASGVVAAGNGAAAATALEPEAVDKSDRSSERPERVLPSISDLLKPGQEIIVQIAKEPLGQKGARITSHIALPGRYVVYMPSVSHLGVSRKIASEEERQRLKRILQRHRTGASGGFIVRTAGEGIPEEEIAADMNFLYNQWLDIRQKAEKRPAPALLHYDLDIVQRILRDHVNDDFKAVWVDTEDMYENVITFLQRFQPALVNRVKMYTRSAPIFDAFNITAELEKALRPKVWLKSGGYIVINQTEALVAIDINTGKFVGKSNRLEDTIVKTNTEAVKEIVRQIRLRDLGGIIVVDFIDMDERKNRQKVMQALEESMRADKAPYKILQFNDFGLVAITRKRVKQSLERSLCAPCPYCEGAGYVKSVQTVIGEILVEAQKLSRAIEGKDVLLRVHPEVAKTLKSSSNRYLEELEEIFGRPVLVKGDPALHTEKFDIA